MYLIDTCVISEIRKGNSSNTGVKQFFTEQAILKPCFLSVITMGEIRKGIDKILLRNDIKQAVMLSDWLELVITQYKNRILEFDQEAALLWGRLCASNDGNVIDKQIAATALVYDLTVVTRNSKDFLKTGVRIYNPFL